MGGGEAWEKEPEPPGTGPSCPLAPTVHQSLCCPLYEHRSSRHPLVTTRKLRLGRGGDLPEVIKLQRAFEM